MSEGDLPRRVYVPPAGLRWARTLTSNSAKRKRLRAQLLAERASCFYCGLKLDAASATLDHVKPLSKGGIDCLTNLVLACAPCNHAKGDRE